MENSKSVDLANLLLKEWQRVKSLPNGDRYHISIVFSQLSKQLGVSDYFVKKWVRNFEKMEAITFVKNSRAKNLFKGGKWRCKYAEYDVDTIKLQRYVDEANPSPYTGEELQFIEYLRQHQSNFTSSHRNQIMRQLNWGDKQFSRKVNKLKESGVLSEWRSAKCQGNFYRYFYSIKELESQSTNAISDTDRNRGLIFSPDYELLDKGINWLLDLVISHLGDFSTITRDTKTDNCFDTLIGQILRDRTYRYQEMKKTYELIYQDKCHDADSYFIISHFRNLYLAHARP